MGCGAVVAQRTLDPLTEVRIFPPQPSHNLADAGKHTGMGMVKDESVRLDCRLRIADCRLSPRDPGGKKSAI